MIINKEHKPSYECMRVAETSYELALRSESDWELQHHLSTGYTFTAFAIEGMFVFYRAQVDHNYDPNKRLKTEDLLKDTAKLVGLSNYFGNRNGQILRECIAIRDSIVHGRFFQSKIENNKYDELPRDEMITGIVSIPSYPFSALILDKLREFIEAAKDTDRVMSQRGLEDGELCLICAFGVSGKSTW